MSNAKLSRYDRKKLHGDSYVESFKKTKSARLERVLQHISLPPGGVVADFGCGSANLLPLLHCNVDKYFGVDFSEDFICTAKKKVFDLSISNAEFYCGAIQDFCLEHQNDFDAVFALDLSEHVYDDEWQEIVLGMHFSLKPGGKVYLHTPNRDFFIELMKAHGIIFRQFPEHIAVRNGDQNATFFIEAGFGDVSLNYLSHYNILRCLHPLSHLPAIGRYFRSRIILTATK
jgi:SAM-dependent methyltransferase